MPNVLGKGLVRLAVAELKVPALLGRAEAAGLSWMLRRVRSTEAREIASRAGDVFRHIGLAAGPLRKRAVVVNFEADVKIRLSALASGVLERINEEERRRIITQADKWISRQATFLGLINTPIGDPIDWHRDYFSGMSGPKKYSGLINHRDSAGVGDIKNIWELNRLQHLVPLSLASEWTRMDAYHREVQEQIQSWREQNPFMVGLNWKSPLEAGLRLITWSIVLFLQSCHPLRSGALQNDLLETVYRHQYFIAKFYSKHSSANNHLIGEMTGLYVASAFWPHFRETNRWRSFARQKLIEEIVRQVEDDGVGKERAIEYQLFILEFFILAGALGHLIGDEFPPEYWRRIGSMAAFLSAISDRNGNAPMFGDGDSGQVISVPQTVQQRLLSVLRLSRHGKQRHAQDEPDLRSRLLLWGGYADEMPLPVRYEPGTGVQSFPRGGYYVLASNRGADDELIVVLDAGPLGLPPLYAHGHADALSFWLSYAGREFLIDPGTFTYYTNQEWREYFRSTAAHNTVRIDGLEQSLAGGRFLWRHVAGCYAEYVENSAASVSVRAFHDGYRWLADPVIHRRELRLNKANGNLTITDWLECQGNHEVEIFFHFSEECHVRQTEPRVFTALNGPRSIDLRLDPGLQPAAFRGSEKPILGWISRTFGVKQPTITVVGRAKIRGATKFVSEILPLQVKFTCGRVPPGLRTYPAARSGKDCANE